MKNKKIIVIILILVVVINILIFLLLVNKKRETVTPEKIVSPTSDEYIQTKSLNIKNSANMSSMELGRLSSMDVLGYAENYVVDFLPDLYAQINDNVEFTEQYFTRKKSAIYKYSHIYRYDDYKNLINTMKKSEINYDEYKTIEFISSINNGESVIINCELTYEGNKTINLQLTYVNGEINKTELKM